MATQSQLTWSGIGIRFLFALLLVLLSYNPTGFSFISWVINGGDSPLVYKVIAGILLIIGWVIYIRATRNSLGPIGVGLAVALFGCMIWLFIEWGLFDPANITTMTWLTEIVLAAVLTAGMIWSHIRRKISGQVDTNELEN